jgi:hypothetical protein
MSNPDPTDVGIVWATLHEYAPEFHAAIVQMATGTSGLAYQGIRLHAQMDMLVWLRANPDAAAVLLGDLPDAIPDPADKWKGWSIHIDDDGTMWNVDPDGNRTPTIRSA